MSNDQKTRLERFIAEGDTQKAVMMLIDLTKEPIYSELNGLVVMLSAQFEKYKEDCIKNILSYEEKGITINKINNSILETIKKFSKLNKEISNKSTLQRRGKETTYLTIIPNIESWEVIGREKELEALYELTSEQDGKSILIHGIGGVGKTTLLMAFANEIGNNYDFQIWIDQHGNFESDLTTNNILLSNLGINPKDLPKNKIESTEFILNKISNLRGSVLFLIDNADENILTYKASFPKNCNTIITSRLNLDFSNKIHLGLLDEEQSIELFFKNYRWEKNIEFVKKILNRVGYHTLTIELISKTAQEVRIKPLKVLIELLEKEGLKISSKTLVKTRHSREKQVENVFQYLCSIFDLVKHNDTELFLLKQFSVLLSGFIKFYDLNEILFLDDKNKDAKEEFIIGLQTLNKKGLLIYDEQNDAYKMHRIIQEVVYSKLNVEYNDVVSTVCGVFNKLFIDQSKNENPIDKIQWIPFSFGLLELFKNEEKQEVAEIWNSLGEIYKFLGRYELALEYFEIAMTKANVVFDEKDIHKAKYLSNQGLVLSDMGKYEQALSMLEKALEIDMFNFDDEEHEYIITRKSNIATVLQKLGDYDRAELLMREILEIELRKHGESHSYIAYDRGNLASILRKQGKLNEAIIEIEKAISIDNNIGGNKHPNSLKRLSIYSHVLFDLKEFEKALEIRKSIVETAINNFGETHPDIADDYHFIATSLLKLKNQQEAKTYIDKSVEIFLKTLGAGHHKTKEALLFQQSFV